ncbi:MAG TPA: hypothetical protein VHA54_09615, partial [Solirubrobacterales bacterium]|nr:hypothetical protein [Solirubrobacterales bacterium]
MALALAAIALASLAASAHAAFGLSEVSGLITAGPTEPRATQAGSSPFEASVTVKLNETAEFPDGSPKTIVAELPPGFVGNPTATPTRCTREEFASLDQSTGLLPLCPASSQVGFAHFSLTGGANLSLPVYNLEPTPGTPAQFGVLVLSTQVVATARVRPGDHGVSVEFRDIPQTLGMRESTFTFWGVPADSRHDFLRNNVCLPDPSGFCFLPGTTASAPPTPFLRLPSDCEAGLQRTTVRADQWADPGAFVSAGFDHDVNGEPLESTGCDRLSFAPSMRVQPTTTQGDAPAGLQVALSFPQNEDPEGLGTPPLRRATVTLPEGMSVNPASAAGLGACTDAQLGLGTDAPIACPESAKIGSVSALSPLLEKPIGGAVYLRTQNSSDPQSGEMFRLALVLSDPERGLLIKLPGQVRAEPGSGRLTTTFDDNPQLPVSEIQLNLKAGPRASLAMPASCGVQTTTAQLTSWAGQVAELRDSFAIPCPSGERFAPRFDAGSANPIAGATAPFAVQVEREDGEQPLGSVVTALPAGLTAYLRGVPYCPESAIAGAGRNSGAAEQSSPSCPAASQVGTVDAGAGAGEPFYVEGKVYLAGPYKGAPLSLAIVTPALAGPFDLGTVVVRAAVRVDPSTAEITAASDPLPQIRAGVPLRLRAIDLNIDRPNFTLNPTS